MLLLCRCPECGRAVAGPAPLDASRPVQCPLCHAQFPLGAAEPVELPELLLLAELEEDEGPDLVVEDANGGADPIESLDLGDVAGDETDEELSLEVEEGERAESREAASSPPAKFTVRAEASRVRGGREPVDAGAFEIATGGRSGATESAAAVAARLRKSTRRGSLFGAVGKVVLGGVAGLALGYYGLNYFGGPRFDRLPVYLPGCPHTYHHWPGSPGGSRAPADAQTSLAGGPGSAPSGVAAREPVAGVRNRPHYSISAVCEATRATHRAFGCERCNSTGKVWQDVVKESPGGNGTSALVTGRERVPCEACQGHPPNAMTPEAYAQFCRLGELVTFADAANRDPTAPWLADVAGLLDLADSSPERREEIGRLAHQDLQRTDRPTPGLLLAGQVRSIRRLGPLYYARVGLAGSARDVLLVSDLPFPFEAQDSIIALGSVVPNPMDRIVGFEGTQAGVIWHGLAVAAR